MTALLAAAILLTTATPPACASIAPAVEHVESRGQTLAVSSTGARGLWQVMPRWSRVPAWLLHVPAVGRWEGCRILWRWRRALAAYNAGVYGLRGRSRAGLRYADAVMRLRIGQ